MSSLPSSKVVAAERVGQATNEPSKAAQGPSLTAKVQTSVHRMTSNPSGRHTELAKQLSKCCKSLLFRLRSLTVRQHKAIPLRVAVARDTHITEDYNIVMPLHTGSVKTLCVRLIILHDSEYKHDCYYS